MSLVPSLLQAIVRVDGEALVMHAGDKPYVVAPTGQVDLASRGLTLDAVNGIVNQLLPVELQNALEEFGAVQHELAPMPEFPGEHFTIVAARGGDDLWAEIRRRRIPEDDRIPEEFFVATHAAQQPDDAYGADHHHAVAAAPDDDELPAEVLGFDPAPAPQPLAMSAELQPSDDVVEIEGDLGLPVETDLWPGRTPAPVSQLVVAPVNQDVEVIDEDAAIEIDVDLEPEPEVEVAPLPLRPAAQLPPPAPVPPPPAPPVVVSAPPVVVAVPIEPVALKVPPAAPLAPPPAPPIVVQPPAPPILVQPPAPPIVVQAEKPSFAPPAAASVKVAPVVAPPPSAPVVLKPPVEPPRVEAPRYEIPAAVPVAPPAPEEKPPIAASIEPVLPVLPPAVVEAPPPAPPIAATIETRQTPPIAASIEPVRPVPPPAVIEAPPIAAVVEPPVRAVPPPVRPIQSETQPAVVLNLSRNPIRTEMPLPPVGDPTLSGLERLLRVSSARGASTLYLSSESRPSVRVDGEVQMLEGEPVHVARDVESLLLTLMPERSHEALRTGAATEWITDLEGVGRVRCMSFRDQRGPGGVFRLMPTRSVSTEQLGLPKPVQALAIEPEGLVLVAGPRSSGKRTTMSAFVDLMNRTRRDHIITIEREINIEHERGNSFISQREVRGGDDEVLAAARAAMREDPDILVIEELRTGALVNVALEAAASGRLVVAGFTAHTATGAIDRIIDLYAPEHHRQVQMALADSLRGVIAQVLLRKVGGGRLPAREVLLNTPAVSSAIAEGKTSQLPMAIEGGRRYGMMPLNDALVGLVQNGQVEAREAYRHSPDRPGFLAALNRQGIDTTFVDRLANG